MCLSNVSVCVNICVSSYVYVDTYVPVWTEESNPDYHPKEPSLLLMTESSIGPEQSV